MLEDHLARWIIRQRWFAGKGRPVETLRVESDTPLAEGLRHLILTLRQGATLDRYQLLLGERAGLPRRLAHAQIAGPYYDAAHDPGRTRLLLTAMAAGADHGPLRFRHPPGVTLDTSPRSLVLGAEQSNTSLVYGEAYICKLFRRLTPGVNPELEITRALSANGAPHVVPPCGWLETDLDGENTTLAITQRYLPTANDGWGLALASVRDLYGSLPGVAAATAGGDFSAEAHRLGQATAEIHRALAAAFPTDVIETPEVKRMVELLRQHLERVAAEVPELTPHLPAIEAAFHAAEENIVQLPVQRVHGDYHLGQVLRIPTDWVILDFEGEPGQPLTERRALTSPLRDLAGMLRSFDYAARHLLLDHPEPAALESRAHAWAARNRTAFLRGYTHAGGRLAESDTALLRALEYGKAVYEVDYEARNRPSWLPIPLAAFHPR